MATDHQPKITVVYFAAAHTCTGLHSEDILLPALPKGAGFPLSNLGNLLIARHSLTGLESVLDTSQWSVDLEMITDVNAVILRGGEEVTATFARQKQATMAADSHSDFQVAIIPPVSGG